MNRGLISEISLDAISHNFKIIKRITKNRNIIAVVKADAYGHGAIEVAKRLVKEGAFAFAVAYTSEAIALRDSGIKIPVLVLFDKYNIEDYFKYNLIPVLYDIKTARLFSKEAAKRRRTINVHLKIDTGMGRIGFSYEEMVKDIYALGNMKNLAIIGLMSHFSDADLADKSYASAQLERFKKARVVMRKMGINPSLCHMANSAATITFPESHMDAVRPGLMLYGYSPITSFKFQVQSSKLKDKIDSENSALVTRHSSLLKPAMTVKTKTLSLRKLTKGTSVSYGRTFITSRDSMIAVLSAGYADGYSRALSNNADVIIRGRRAPVIGRICMDTTMVDVTGITDVAEGDEVILLGRYKGEAVTASELARRANTISYEILTSFGNNAHRRYV